MPAPPWLQNALVVVGRTGAKALRQGMREGATNAIDSVLEDVQAFTEEVGRRVRASRSALKDEPKARAPKARKRKKAEPVEVTEVIDAEFEEEKE